MSLLENPYLSYVGGFEHQHTVKSQMAARTNNTLLSPIEWLLLSVHYG